MSITFNQFLSRIDEAFPTWGSSPRRDKPTGQLSPRSRTRGRTGPTLDWRAPEPNQRIPNPQEPKKGGITFVDKGTQKPKPPKPPKVELGLKNLGGGEKPSVTFNRSMRKRGFVPIGGSGKEVKGAAYNSLVRGLRKQTQAEEFINLYRQSIID